MSFVSFQLESPFGSWRHTEWRPAHLRGVIDFLWHFEGTVTLVRERAFPNGMIELIVHLGERFQVVQAPDAGPCATTCLGGIQTGPFVIEAPPGIVQVLGVRMRPSGAYALLGRPLHEMTGLANVDFQDLVGRGAAELAERCRGALSAEESLRAAASWISERLRRAPEVDPAVAWAASRIERESGAVSISALRDRTGLTKTRFAVLFREQIGVAPKLYARIHRFRRLITRLSEGRTPLADLALESGYYDQPHMNAEFRELSGLTPREFLAANRYPGSPSIAEESL